MTVEKIILGLLAGKHPDEDIYDSYNRVKTLVMKTDIKIAQAIKGISNDRLLFDIEEQVLKVELLLKSYFLGVLVDRKKLRILAMDGIKKTPDNIKKYVLDFKSLWKALVEDSKDCNEKPFCDKKEK